jgi:hypothetical protein
LKSVERFEVCVIFWKFAIKTCSAGLRRHVWTSVLSCLQFESFQMKLSF